MNLEKIATRIAESKSDNNADQAYRSRLRETRRLLSDIEKALSTHEKEQKEDKGNWGFAGDLGRVKEDLTDILKFLRNEG
jgi:hypothetical protein